MPTLLTKLVSCFNYSNKNIIVHSTKFSHNTYRNFFIVLFFVFVFSVIRITTCGNTGRTGPNSEQCTEEYNSTDIEVLAPSAAVEESPPSNLNGVQRWTAPRGGYYT